MLGTGSLDQLGRPAAAYGDREALVEVQSGRRWTYGELDRDVDALAIGLLRAGITQGDRVWRSGHPTAPSGR